MTNDNEPPTKGSQYRHDDGTVEVVFATEGDRVLTVREYPTRDLFEAAIGAAVDDGTNRHVSELPDLTDVDEDRSDGER